LDERTAATTTILIVEDEQPVRDMLAMLLEEDGYEVLQAIHGQQALTLVAAQRPDLVISDVMMPVLDGVELCRRLKGSHETEAIPVILMSSAAQPAALRANPDGFIEKPFQITAVESLVTELLGAPDEEQASGSAR